MNIERLVVIGILVVIFVWVVKNLI